MTTTVDLPSMAENRANEALKYDAFNTINLHNVRQAVTELLAQIGKAGMFEQYTKHDITHIDKLLATLDWLIPPATQTAMSPADWLMIVLAIYFHDLGMLVTRSEFEQRQVSMFDQYEDSVQSGDLGKDYKSKVLEMEPDQQQPFLYQEFVRTNHTKRIRQWLTGQMTNEYGASETVGNEIKNLVAPLGTKFRLDLALVCESHHLDDLGDFTKYKVSQPYGDTSQETANLQYAAVLLRTVDLLHVTRDRTPSIAFRVINPSDPISQEEWHKQMAVVSVRSRIALDKEGHADATLPRDTIEMHAFFESPRGFFALTKYVSYVVGQIRTSYEWCREAKLAKGIPHEFPWRYIDDAGIATHGFLSKQFEFTLDQARILDLLTGHTLYNDLRVVLRELVQNSLDAIRLQALIDKAPPSSITIGWNSTSRELTVQDQGTGMTQDIIERHLLEVGSSRYQDPEFQKQHPTFSPISRFGIGVLSACMISDEVEIISCHEAEERARQLSLRSVHGKYLIRLLDKTAGEVVALAPHGTSIRLRVRASVKMPDVLETARAWILIPGCQVSVDSDGVTDYVGFPSLKEAVVDYCKVEFPGIFEDPVRKATVIERAIDGIGVAFAVEWSETFKEWNFVKPRRRANGQIRQLGTCIEGIRVTSETPAFGGYPIVAMANASGLSAPKTNVARSGLESSPELESAFGNIYKMLCDHVASEIQSLVSQRGFSPTWSAGEGKWIMKPLTNFDESKPLDHRLLAAEMDKTPVLVVERAGKRELASPAQFQAEPVFWTIDSGFFYSAEYLLREVPGHGSLAVLAKAIGVSEFPLPSDPILCGLESWEVLDRDAFLGKEVSEFKLFESERRADLKWTSIGNSPTWQRIPEGVKALVRHSSDVFVARGSVPLTTFKPFTAVRASRQLFVLHNSPLAPVLLRLTQDALNEGFPGPAIIMLAAVCAAALSKFVQNVDLDDSQLLEQHIQRVPRFEEAKVKYNSVVLAAMKSEPWLCFDPSRWARKGPAYA